MKIAIDISPLKTGHKVRGVGFYLQHLKDALITYFPQHEYVFFTGQEEIPPDVDLVHYPYFDPFFITLPLLEKHRRVVTVHDLIPIVFPEQFPAGIRGKLSWQLQKFNLRKSDVIITDSESSTKDVAKFTGIATSKITTVYLAAGEEFKRTESAELRTEILKKYKLPEEFVLYVGDVTWNKNLPRLVAAIKQLDIPLVMVGKSLVQKDINTTNPWNADLVAIQKATANDKRFIKLGFVPTDDVVSLYNSATVCAFPSIYEGFGLPVLEAMQCGCPVVTTEGGSLPEVADSAAFYVDEYSLDSIAKGIDKVFSDKQLQKTLSSKGLIQAKQFSWKKTAEETLAAYTQAIS